MQIECYKTGWRTDGAKPGKDWFEVFIRVAENKGRPIYLHLDITPRSWSSDLHYGSPAHCVTVGKPAKMPEFIKTFLKKEFGI